MTGYGITVGITLGGQDRARQREPYIPGVLHIPIDVCEICKQEAVNKQSASPTILPPAEEVVHSTKYHHEPPKGFWAWFDFMTGG